MVNERPGHVRVPHVSESFSAVRQYNTHGEVCLSNLTAINKPPDDLRPPPGSARLYITYRVRMKVAIACDVSICLSKYYCIIHLIGWQQTDADRPRFSTAALLQNAPFFSKSVLWIEIVVISFALFSGKGM